MSSTVIKIASTLILAVQQPQSVPVSGTRVWISDPRVATAQSLGANTALLVGGELGEAFVYGLQGREAQRLVVTSAKNFRGLQKCPDFATSLEAMPDGSLALADLSSARLERVRSCGFDRLRAPDVAQLGALALQARPELAKLALTPEHATPRDGALRWHVPPEKIPPLRRALGPLAAFSEFSGAASGVAETIVFKLDLFEFSNSSARGLDFRGLVRGQSTDRLDLALVYSKAEQSGKLLASPQLRTMPGKTAEFNSGGEIPVQDAQVIGAKTSWKAYGLKILITPRADASPLASEVSTTIEIEYSQPDYGTGSGGVPALVKRNLKNEFSLAMAQTTLLTSMVQIRRGRSSERQWGFGALPLFGGLFGGHQESRDESEIWFLISPAWATPLPAGQAAQKWNQNESE